MSFLVSQIRRNQGTTAHPSSALEKQALSTQLRFLGHVSGMRIVGKTSQAVVLPSFKSNAQEAETGGSL